MREKFFRLLPYVLGFVIGLLIVSPPAAFAALGAWRPLVILALIAVELIAMVILTLFISLPANPTLEFVPAEPEPPEVSALLAQYQQLGFERLAAPMRVDLRPSAIVWTLVRPDIEGWATVYMTGTIPRRFGYDLFSYFTGGRGALTTLSDPSGAVFPSTPGYFRQILRGAVPQDLLTFHRAAQAFLLRQGVTFEPPRPENAIEMLRASLVRQRRTAFANPFKTAVLTLWRVVTKKSPYTRPLENQPGVAAEVRKVLGG